MLPVVQEIFFSSTKSPTGTTRLGTPLGGLKLDVELEINGFIHQIEFVLYCGLRQKSESKWRKYKPGCNFFENG